MISLIDFQNKIIKIIDKGINEYNSFEIKNDGSIVTNVDKNIETEIIEFLKLNFNGINIISEENPSSHKSMYDLSTKRFAIIDPIDGTENFLYLKDSYGSVVSVVYDDFEYHGIYIPSLKSIVSNINPFKVSELSPTIKLLSTSCMNNYSFKDVKDRQKIRIVGSSSYMFYLLLSGKAQEYTYCKNAKIWDYFTGLSLLNLNPKLFNISINNTSKKLDQFSLMPHFITFKAERNNFIK
jgi:fructose-1,6-bisphosphatase/inositol monophosphatase family enzyme